MSISDKLLEFTRSLDEVDQSDKDYYSQLDMADKMAMGMGGLGTLYGSAAEQAGLPVQDWSKKNLSPEAMNQAGIALSNTAANWTPEQAQVFEGIQNIPSQMIQPVQQPQMPQQPLTQTQQNVIAGENSMNRMQQEVDYAKSQQAAQVKNQAAQQVQNKAGIAALSDEDLQIAKEETRGLVQQAVIDQTDDIDDTTQAAKETQGWSEEHFRGAIKAIDILLQKTNPQSAEYMSLQNRKADLIRVYESQKGSDDPYRAMEGQIATNQSQAQQKDDTAQMQLLADEQQATVAQAVDEQDTLNMLSDWDADTQMSGIDDAYADLDAGYAKRAADKEQERQQYSRDIAQGFKSNDARNMAADFKAKDEDELDTRQMLADWDAETADDAAMGNIDDIYANLDADYATRQQEKANAEADYLNDPQGDETKSLVATIATEEKEAWEKGQVTANEAYQRIINDADQAYEDELAGDDAKIAEFNANLEGVVEEVASSGDENAVAGITKLKKEMSNSVVNSDGTMKSSAEIRSMTAKLLKEALAIENKKNVDRDWGPAMMQFGLTLMSTPGNLLTGIGIAGKDALKMWQDIKKGDKDSVTAKRELALKYAELADTKDKATLDSKDKTIPMYSINEAGKLVETTTKRPSTEGESSNMRLSNMSNLIMSGKVEKLSEEDAENLTRQYQGILGEYMKDNFKTGEREWRSGMENPTTIYNKLAKMFPNNEAIQSAKTSWSAGSAQGKQRREYQDVHADFLAYQDNSAIFRRHLETIGPDVTTWYGGAVKAVSGAISPFLTSEVEEGVDMDTLSEKYFKEYAGIEDTVQLSGKVQQTYTMAYGLARDYMRVAFGEKGRALSDKDMEVAMKMIASSIGTTATPATMTAAMDAANAALMNKRFRNYQKLYSVEGKGTEALRSDFLLSMDKEYAVAHGQRVGGKWADALPASYRGGTETTSVDISQQLPAAISYFNELKAKYPGDNASITRDLRVYLSQFKSKEIRIAIINVLQGQDK